MTTTAGPTSPVGSTPHPWRSLVLATVGLAVVGVVLWWTGNALPGPGSYDRPGFAAWLGDTDPVVAAFAIIRLVGLGLVTWTLLTGAVALVANRTRLRRRRRLRRLIDRLCFPAVRRLVHGAVGVAIAATTITPGAAGATTDAGVRQFATVTALEDATTTTTVTTTTVTPSSVATTVPAPAAGPTPVQSSAGEDHLARVVALDDAGPTPDPAHGPSGRPNAASTPPAEAGPHIPATWQLRPGEHLWHVAEATLTRHLERSPSEEETSAYLEALVEVNRHRLVVPANPDLVLAGQVVELPDPGHLPG